MSIKYTYEGEDISEDFVTEGFEQSSFTVLDEYISNTDGLEVVEEKVGKTSDVAAKDAVVTSSPGQASESTELEQVDTSLVSEDPEPIVSASKQRIAARKKREQEKQKQEKEKSFFNDIFSDEPVYDKTKSFRDKRNKIAQIAKDRAELERKATVYSYNNMPGLESVAYVEDQLKEFDKTAAKELELLNSDPEFKLRNDAIEQLSKNTGSNQAAGDGLEDTLSEFNVLNVFRGKSYFKDVEASEIIDLNAEVEDAVVSKLDNRQLQKLSKGFYTLQEKENLLNEVKVPIVQNKIKEIEDDGKAELVKTEDQISNYKKAQEAIIKSLNILKSNPNITEEDINEYNLLVNNYKDIDTQLENTVNNFESYKTKSLSKINSLEGDFGIDLATGVINNNFKLSDRVEKFREKYSGDGWWNGAADIIGGELMQGAYQLIKKTNIGAPTWLLTSFGDAFQDQDNYSDFDAFSDVINNWSNKTILPKSQAEKFKITKEEGGFREFDARNYAKLGVSMVPFTAQLISEVKKGKFTGLRSAIGKNYLKLGDKSKVLKDASQQLKNNIIMADAAFRATIMDNQKEGEALGLNGLQASTFAAAKSATEASVQLIMPDTQFLKGVSGKAIKDAFVGNLKKVANIEGAKSAVKEFSTNILKEYGEEQVNAAMNLVTDASYGLALPKASEFLNSQIELTAGTFMLSGGMGTVGSSKTFSNQKKLIYNQIHDNIASLDLGLKTMQEASKNSENIDQIIKARKFARDISKAVESSPENVTADQIDLLLEKQKLIKKKETTDSAFHPDINSKIEEVNAKINDSSVKRDVAEQFDKDIKNVGKSLNSIGQKVDETIVFEDNEKGSASDQMKEFLISTGKSKEYAEENKNSYGAFTMKDGKEVLVINKTSALSDSFVTTGQHEFLHKLLKASLSSNPSLITEAGSLLLKEIKSTVSADTELASRIESYARDTEITNEKFFEEILPLFSEALTRKDVKLNDSSLKKISDFFRRVFQNMGLKKIKFDTSDGVINFIKDYNKAYSKGEFKGALKTLSKGDIKESVEISLSKNKELGNEIKALVPEGTTKRRYDSRVIGDVYAKLVQGSTLDGLINGQLNKFGVVGDNVYGKPKDVFLEDVKAQLYEKSLTRFNPESNDDLGGFVVNELIRYRIGDVVNRYKKEAGVSGKSLDVAAGEAGSVQEVADQSVSIEDQIDVADAVSKADSKLTKATKILSKEQYKEASEIIKEKVKDIDPKNLSYKKVGGFITDILSYITSVPADKILDSTKNLSQGQVTTAAMFIEKNIDYVRRTLPEGAVLGAATEKLMGTSTGVANSVLKRLYDKNPRIKKGQGLSPWTLKKGLTNNDILEAIGRPKGVEPKPISPRSPEGQVVKGILNIVDKNITNELVRTVESDLTLEQKQDVAAGKSVLMFSKSFNLGLENGSNPENISSILFSKAARKNYEQVLKAKRPELKDIPKQVDNLINWADSLDIRDNKKAKYKKLGLFYMANGYAIFPEDGYKIEESIRLAAINKIDPYAFKNPNELIEKYEKTTKIAKINPDSVKEFSNKEEIAGLTIYDVEDSKKGQEAVRRIIDSNWGKKANPWCLAARANSIKESTQTDTLEEAKNIAKRFKLNGYTTVDIVKENEVIYYVDAEKKVSKENSLDEAFDMWEGYNKKGNGFKIAFNNGKLNSFRDGNDMQWWDRMDKPQKGPAVKIKADPNGLVGEGYIDLKSKEQVIEGYKKDYKEGDLTIEEGYTKDKKLEYKNTYGKNKFSDKSLISDYTFDRIDSNDYIEIENKYGENNSRVTKINRKFDSPGNKLHKKTLRKRYYDKNNNIIDEVKEKDILTGVITEEIFFIDNNTGYGLFDVYKAETINGKKKVSIDQRKRFLNNNNPFSNNIVSFSKKLNIEKLLIQDFISQKPGKVSARKQNSYARTIKELLEYGVVNGVNNFERAVELGKYTKDELDLINFVFEGRDWLFGIFQDEQTLNQGLKLEKLVKVAIKKIGLKDVSLDLSEGGFSSGVDIVLSVKNKKLNIELKLNEKARVGSFTIKRDGDVFSYTKGVEGIETKIPALHKAIQDELKGDKYQKAWKKYTEEGLKIGKKLLDEGKTNIQTYVNTETGQLIGPKEVFNDLKDPKLYNFQKDLTIIINQIDGKPIDQKIIELLYNNKDVNDINFGGVGMFALGESVSGRPKLDANVEVRIVTSRASSNGIYRSIQRATPFILEINNTSDIDLADLSNVQSNVEELVESISDTSFSKVSNLDKAFNDILENKSGIPSRKRYGIVEAITKGSSKGKFNFFIPPSAEDFVGLLYPTLGKGELGDAQMSWYKKNLIDPYAEAMNKLSRARIYLMNNYNLLKKQLDVVPKDLGKKIKGTDYTREQAVRVYIWNKQKMNIPGISDADVSELVSYVADDANLQIFGDQLINMQMGDGYIKPKESWPAGTITTDILEGLNTTKRAKYLKNWQENVDEIFSEENLNKLQAIYGLNYRKALENMLKRMKTGRNRSFPGDSLTGRVTDWLTGSVGTIMFLNTRSAVLQTISAINFVNFTDNNILAAGKAFANQKQYWADFMKLMNSDFLKERRGGLRINVNEADIADMAKKGGAKGAISKLLELGFAPTQIADSFAIASGGSTFYRNRINTYLKETDANGNNIYTEKQAEKKAFEDFRETAEESQQSSRADRISMQQASPLGRVVLAFANTPAQYARIIKKAASDLKNGRGDAKTNISKIIYYGFAQNLIFNALQQALFAVAFGDEETEDEEKQKKHLNIANGMLDSILRGSGIGGAIVSVGKNAVIKLVKELEKDRPKLQNVAAEVLKISPPISAKYSRLVQAGKSYDWNKDEMKEKGLSLDNPAFLAGGNVLSALTNIPLDRAIKKANNVVAATSQDLETWERLALLGGWQEWELGIKKEDKKEKKKPTKITRKRGITSRSITK